MEFEKTILHPGVSLWPTIRGFEFDARFSDAERWSPWKFKEGLGPYFIGTAKRDIITTRILDCPIKFPGSNEFRIPSELMPLMNNIKKIIDLECARNYAFDEYFAYVTTDYSTVEKGTTQRKGGLHVDGYQGARTSKNERINRSYIYSSTQPTEFLFAGIDIQHIDDSKYDVFKYMDKVAPKDMIGAWDSWDIMFMNVYNIHRCPVMEKTEERFFFRLSFDVRKFDRLGNTHNPMFDYNWEMVERDTQKHLIEL